MKIPKTTNVLDNKPLRNCVKTVCVAKIQPYVFICADQIVPKSNTKQANLESWERLLLRLQKPKLDQAQDEYPSCISQTKTNCLRVCCSRPIMVVYPDGVWYRQVTPEVIKRLNQKHLIGIMVVEEYAFLTQHVPETSFLYQRTSNRGLSSTGYETAVSIIKALGWFLARVIEPPIPTCEHKGLLFNQCFSPAT